MLDSGLGEEMVERMVGAGEGEIEELAEKFGEEVSESFLNNLSRLNVKWLWRMRWQRSLLSFLVR